MQDKEILSAVADTFIDKPKYQITIPVSWFPEVVLPKRTFWDKLLRRPLPVLPEIETERTFTIYPCKVANMFRIAGKAVLLPDELKQGELWGVVLPLINQHLNDIVYIVAAGIQNNHLEPDPDLITFIERNFDAKDLYDSMFPVLESVGMQSFLSSIVLTKGITALNPKTSPADGSE